MKIKFTVKDATNILKNAKAVKGLQIVMVLSMLKLFGGLIYKHPKAKKVNGIG
jgi:hypothetical protein